MIRVLSHPRRYRGSTAVGLVIALALTALTSVLSAGPAAAAASCGLPRGVGGYSVTACIGGSAPDGSYTYGYIYITLPAGHAPCTIHGKIRDELNPSSVGVTQTWPCPSGGPVNSRYDIGVSPYADFFSKGRITNNSGYTVVAAYSLN